MNCNSFLLKYRGFDIQVNILLTIWWYNILVDVKPEQYVRESTGSECPQEKDLARNIFNISENTGNL